MFLLFLLGISFYSLAGQDGKDILGTWKYKVVMSEGELTGTLVFENKDGAVAGEVQTDDGQIIAFNKIEPRKDNSFYMELDNGYEILEITVTVKDKTFEGTVDSQSESFDLTGEKVE